MGRASHLTAKERDKISVLHSAGYHSSKIARLIGRDKSTVSRELNRVTSVFYQEKYIGSQSHKNVQIEWSNAHKRDRIPNGEIRDYIIEKLKLKWSPEQIAGRMEKDIGKKVSHEAIYMFVYKKMPELTEFLTRKHLGRKTRRVVKSSRITRIPNRIDIDLRPQEANRREEFGHFEADCVESSRSCKTALLVVTDRATRMTKIKKLERKTAFLASNAIIFALKNFNSIKLHTITYDNGSEFCYHEKVNQELNVKSFFCKAYHSWEKGTVENINGLIRRFFPKGTDFDKITDEKIQYVEDWINNRPMKCLQFKTPLETFSILQKLTNVAITS